MSLYGSFNDGWKSEVAYWKSKGMGGKLGVGFCPTCGKEAPSQIAAKFAAAADSDEIDMFAYGAGTETSFAPYWDDMKKFCGADCGN